MNREDIELFQAILKEKSIQKAAVSLYLSPTTAGSRLKALENELGAPLFERHKGIRSVELTETGRKFAEISGQMLALLNACTDLQQMKRQRPITIATADSFLEYNLVPLLKNRLERDRYHFDLQLYPSDMIFPLVSKSGADLGFSLYTVQYMNVESELLFSDDVVVVVPEGLFPGKTSIHPRDLNPEKEFRIGSPKNDNVGWGAAFSVWHRQWFDVTAVPRLRVNSVSVLSYFLSETDYWTFLPKSLALGYREQYRLQILDLEVPVPKRFCYSLINKHMPKEQKKETEAFLRLLKQDLQQIPGIVLPDQ